MKLKMEVGLKYNHKNSKAKTLFSMKYHITERFELSENKSMRMLKNIHK